MRDSDPTEMLPFRVHFFHTRQGMEQRDYEDVHAENPDQARVTARPRIRSRVGIDFRITKTKLRRQVR